MTARSAQSLAPRRLWLVAAAVVVLLMSVGTAAADGGVTSCQPADAIPVEVAGDCRTLTVSATLPPNGCLLYRWDRETVRHLSYAGQFPLPEQVALWVGGDEAFHNVKARSRLEARPHGGFFIPEDNGYQYLAIENRVDTEHTGTLGTVTFCGVQSLALDTEQAGTKMEPNGWAYYSVHAYPGFSTLAVVVTPTDAQATPLSVAIRAQYTPTLDGHDAITHAAQGDGLYFLDWSLYSMPLSGRKYFVGVYAQGASAEYTIAAHVTTAVAPGNTVAFDAPAPNAPTYIRIPAQDFELLSVTVRLAQPTAAGSPYQVRLRANEVPNLQSNGDDIVLTAESSNPTTFDWSTPVSGEVWYAVVLAGADPVAFTVETNGIVKSSGGGHTWIPPPMIPTEIQSAGGVGLIVALSVVGAACVGLLLVMGARFILMRRRGGSGLSLPSFSFSSSSAKYRRVNTEDNEDLGNLNDDL